MFDLYTFTTPNGRKISIALEELELPYEVHKIDITKGEQFTPEYVDVSNGKRRADVRSIQSLQSLCTRKNTLRDRTLSKRNAETLWRTRSTLIRLSNRYNF